VRDVGGDSATHSRTSAKRVGEVVPVSARLAPSGGVENARREVSEPCWRREGGNERTVRGCGRAPGAGDNGAVGWRISMRAGDVGPDTLERPRRPRKKRTRSCWSAPVMRHRVAARARVGRARRANRTGDASAGARPECGCGLGARRGDSGALGTIRPEVSQTSPSRVYRQLTWTGLNRMMYREGCGGRQFGELAAIPPSGFGNAVVRP